MLQEGTELCRIQWFGEPVGMVLLRFNLSYIDDSSHNTLAHEVVAYFNVLRSTKRLCVISLSVVRSIVRKKIYRRMHVKTKFCEEQTSTLDLTTTFTQRNVFSFCRRQCRCVLLLAGPREDASIEVPNPSNTRFARQLISRKI